MNMIALMYGLVARGCLRVAINDSRAAMEDAPLWRKLLRIAVEPFTINAVRCLIWVSFAQQLFLSHMYLVMFVALEAIDSLCGTSHAEVQSSVRGMNRFMTTAGVGTMDLKFVSDFCSEDADVLQASLMAFLGCFITVISQSVMLAAVVPEQVVLGANIVASGDSASDVMRIQAADMLDDVSPVRNPKLVRNPTPRAPLNKMGTFHSLDSDEDNKSNQSALAWAKNGLGYNVGSFRNLGEFMGFGQAQENSKPSLRKGDTRTTLGTEGSSDTVSKLPRPEWAQARKNLSRIF
jgi:hypothetical protein